MPARSARLPVALTSPPAHLESGLDAALALPWLLRLRWGAVFGQLATVVVATMVARVDLPWLTLVWLIALTASTNLAMSFHPIRQWASVDGLATGLLLLDTLTLTLMLALTGGSANPFAIFYLVHVAMAAVILGQVWPWAIAGISSVAYTALAVWYRPLPGPWQWDLGHGGVLVIVAECVSFTLVALLSTFFLTRLTEALRARERDIEIARQSAMRSARIATVTTLGAGAAHELGTPLGTIAIAAKELERALGARLAAPQGGTVDPVDEELRDDARLIRGEVDRCREILDRLGIHRIDDANALESIAVRALEDDLRSALGGQSARVHVRASVDRVTTSRTALLTALLALLRNGLLASRNDQPVSLDIKVRGGVAEFRVCDQGEGMSEEVLSRLGDPFFRARSRSDGMGLGVFLAELLAEQLGGSLRYESEEGTGTTAILRLPCDTVPQRGGAGEGLEGARLRS